MEICAPLLDSDDARSGNSDFLTIFAILLIVSMSMCCVVTNSFAVAGCMAAYELPNRTLCIHGGRCASWKIFADLLILIRTNAWLCFALLGVLFLFILLNSGTAFTVPTGLAAFFNFVAAVTLRIRVKTTGAELRPQLRPIRLTPIPDNFRANHLSLVKSRLDRHAQTFVVPVRVKSREQASGPDNNTDDRDMHTLELSGLSMTREASPSSDFDRPVFVHTGCPRRAEPTRPTKFCPGIRLMVYDADELIGKTRPLDSLEMASTLQDFRKRSNAQAMSDDSPPVKLEVDHEESAETVYQSAAVKRLRQRKQAAVSTGSSKRQHVPLSLKVPIPPGRVVLECGHLSPPPVGKQRKVTSHPPARRRSRSRDGSSQSKDHTAGLEKDQNNDSEANELQIDIKGSDNREVLIGIEACCSRKSTGVVSEDDEEKQQPAIESAEETVEEITAPACKGCEVDGESCIVCIEEFAAGEKVMLLPCCQNYFHRTCLEDWVFTQLEREYQLGQQNGSRRNNNNGRQAQGGNGSSGTPRDGDVSEAAVRRVHEPRVGSCPMCRADF